MVDRIDPVVLARFREMEESVGEGLLAETITDFETHSQVRIEKLAAALEAGDAARFEREAHTLKGGAAMLGARRLQALALAAERTAESGDLTDAEPMIAQLRQELADTVSALRSG